MLLLIAALALPIKQTCGNPRYSCATAPDAQGYVHYYYEVQPLGVVLIIQLMFACFLWFTWGLGVFGVGVLSTVASGEGERDRGCEEVEDAALGGGGGAQGRHDGSVGAVADVVAGQGG